MTDNLEYEIEKDNSKKSVLITIGAFIIFLASLIVIYGPEIISGLKGGSVSGPGILGGSIVLGLIIISIGAVFYVRFKNWRNPLEVAWNLSGMVIRYPGGKTKTFYWKDISEIRLEGENWAKTLVPYYYVGRFSWNSMFWLLYIGVTKLAWRIDFAFFHFKTKDNKIIVVPIKKEKINEALSFLKSVRANNTNVKSFSETKTKWWLIGLLISIPFVIMPAFIVFINIKNLVFVGIGIFAIIPTIFLIYIIKSFRRKRAIIEGLVAEGSASYVINLICLIIDLAFFVLVGFFIFLALGGTSTAPSQYNYANVTFPARMLNPNNLTLLPSDFVVLRTDSFNNKNSGANWCNDPSLNKRDTLEIWIKENPILAPYIKHTYPVVALNDQPLQSIHSPPLDAQGTSYPNEFMLQEGIQTDQQNNITICFQINDTASNILSNQICLNPLRISAEC